MTTVMMLVLARSLDSLLLRERAQWEVHPTMLHLFQSEPLKIRNETHRYSPRKAGRSNKSTIK